MKFWLSMAVLVLVVPCGCLLAAGFVRRRYQQRDVSRAWVRDHDRRLNGRGLDGVCWTWPYRGYKESSVFNAAQLRKRA